MASDKSWRGCFWGKIELMSLFFLFKTYLNHQYAHLMYSVVKMLTLSKPLNPNKYFCISMSGNSYGDNVKCLSDYIHEHQQDAEIIWAFSSGFIKKVECPHTTVKLYSFKYYYHVLTSKYILSNARLNQRMLHKRKGQVYLQTWHGTALKRLGYDIKKDRNLLQRIVKPDVFEFDVRNTDIMISGSRFMTNVFRNSFRFSGKILETGTPRNDIFFGDHPEIRERICQMYGVESDTQIILYAPTFRSNGTFDYYDVDSDLLQREWSKKTGKKCVFMVRLHPNLMHRSREMSTLFPNAINVSSYPDMQELLYATDLLVTDYSSSMFDFMYTFRPVLLYMPDYESYDRGYYFRLEDLPFILVKSNDYISNAVNELSYITYKNKVVVFLAQIGSVETGHASVNVCKELNSIVFNEK